MNRLKAGLSLFFLSVASPALPAPPSSDLSNPEIVFRQRDRSDAGYTEALRAAARQDPVRAYRVARIIDPDNPGRFTEPNRRIAVSIALQSMQAQMDRAWPDASAEAELLHVNTINSLFEMSPALRFETVQGLNASGVYQLLTKGRAELFTSTFTHLYEAFTARLEKEGRTFGDFLAQRPEHAMHLPAFIDGLSTFGKFDNFAARLTTAEKQDMMTRMMDEATQHPIKAVAVANFAAGLSARDPALLSFEARLLRDHASATRLFDQDTYGILARLYVETHPALPADRTAALQKIAGDDRYTLPAFDKLDTADLFDATGRNFQLHMFYNDTDGIANYDSYRTMLRADGWRETADREGGFAHFQKTASNRTIHIYATVPTLSRQYDDEDTIARARNARAAIEAQGGHVSVLVHRGHSTTVNATIMQTDRHVKVAFLGACGGTQYVQGVLTRSSAAHIVSSRNTGYRVINNHLLKHINALVLAQTQIDWQQIGAAAVRTHGAPARDYVMPLDNRAARVISHFLDLRQRPATRRMDARYSVTPPR